MDQPAQGGSDLTVDEALGATSKIQEWRSADGRVWCTYARPKGVVSVIISRALGAENAGNVIMQAQYRALLSIITWRGQKIVPPADAEAFQRAIDRFGNDEGADERFNAYVAAAFTAIYPANLSDLATAEK